MESDEGEVHGRTVSLWKVGCCTGRKSTPAGGRSAPDARGNAREPEGGPRDGELSPRDAAGSPREGGRLPGLLARPEGPAAGPRKASRKLVAPLLGSEMPALFPADRELRSGPAPSFDPGKGAG